MRDSDYKEKIAALADNDQEKEERKTIKRASIAVILIVLILVAVLSTIVYVVELNFGRTAGNVVLIVLAVLIAGYLYRKEIAAKFKRK